MVHADLDAPASLVEALTGADVVVHAAGHYPRTSLDRADTLAHGLRQTRTVLDVAARCGVRRLVYVSSTATVAARRDGRPSGESDVFDGPPGLGVYHELKWEMEALVASERRFEVVIACPSGCLGPEDQRLGTSGLLLAAARGWNPPHPDGLVSFVDVRDVARGLACLADMPLPPPRIVLSGGEVRLHAFLVALARRYGTPAPSPALSDADAVAFADAEELRTSGSNARPGLSREIVDLVLHGRPLDTRLAEAALGLEWTPLGSTLDAFDAWARRARLLPTVSANEVSA